MNVRNEANRTLASVQTALRSGEWITDGSGTVEAAAEALDDALWTMADVDAIGRRLDDLRSLVDQAIAKGDWMPGSWTCDLEIEAATIGAIVPMRHASAPLGRLAA